ncbi:prohibitin-1, mitochondrial-like protein [Tanacetum coccineum]
MTRSTTKKLTEPLEEPEREMHKLRKVARRQQHNESLAIAGQNLFDDELIPFSKPNRSSYGDNKEGLGIAIWVANQSFDDWRFAAGHVVRVHGYGGKANPIVMHVLGFDADTYTHLRDERKRRWSQRSRSFYSECVLRMESGVGKEAGTGLMEDQSCRRDERALSFLPSSTQRDHGAWTQHWWWKGFTLATNARYALIHGFDWLVIRFVVKTMYVLCTCDVPAVSRETMQILIERVANFNMALDDVSIANPTFGRECTAAIEAKQMVAHKLEKVG